MNKKVFPATYIVGGPLEIVLKSGEVYTIGKRIKEKEKIFIPEGKRIPLEVVRDAEIEFSRDVELNSLPKRTIPEDWDSVVRYIMEKKINTLLIFGEVDTGKTFFSTYLTNKLVENSLRVSVLDCDTGQSDIGLPGSLGVTVFKEPVLFMPDVEPDGLFFVGSHSPSEHLLHYSAGFVKMVNFGLKNSDVVIIDTPGWVQSDGGRALRRTEIEILQGLDTNYCVVLLQRANELEHLVKGILAERIIRLTVSKKASPTSVEERQKLREFIYKRYFTNSKIVDFSFGEIFTDRSYFLSGFEIDVKKFGKNIVWVERLSNWEGVFVVSEKELKKAAIEKLKKQLGVGRVLVSTKQNYQGIVCALLNSSCDVIGFCMIEDIDFLNKKIYIRTPLYSSKDKIKGIQFGSIRVNSLGEESGFVVPGTV